MKNIAILGCTGSIGRQTLDVCSRFPEEMNVTVLAALNEVVELAQMARSCLPELVAIADEDKYGALKEALAGENCEIVAGNEAVAIAATHSSVDLVVGAISGVAGLVPMMAALEAGKDIALANKEVLVAAGHIFMPLVKEKGVKLLPLDSEHSAIFQCLEQDKNVVHSLLLTASGGPFRSYSKDELQEVTAAEALCHPTWLMGPKITVDSATLMNKGLEVIEAHWLFDMPYDKIDVVIHPESIVHSLVQYADGSLLAHLGPPDMRIPIQYALTYPKRQANNLEHIDLAGISALHFEKPDLERFPCLQLALEAGRMGGCYPAVLNGANEVLVAAFLAGEISFPEIGDNMARIMEAYSTSCFDSGAVTIEEVLIADEWGRAQACRSR